MSVDMIALPGSYTTHACDNGWQIHIWKAKDGWRYRMFIQSDLRIESEGGGTLPFSLCPTIGDALNKVVWLSEQAPTIERIFEALQNRASGV